MIDQNACKTESLTTWFPVAHLGNNIMYSPPLRNLPLYIREKYDLKVLNFISGSDDHYHSFYSQGRRPKKAPDDRSKKPARVPFVIWSSYLFFFLFVKPEILISVFMTKLVLVKLLTLTNISYCLSASLLKWNIWFMLRWICRVIFGRTIRLTFCDHCIWYLFFDVLFACKYAILSRLVVCNSSMDS